MCWVGEPFEKVADKDIKVYKVVRATHFTNKQGRDEVQAEAWYRRDTVYFPGKRYHLGKKISPRRTRNFCECYIEEGFHSYSAENTRITYSFHYGWLKVDSRNKFCLDVYHYLPSVLICIIPKGTTYYENDRGEIVSEELVTQNIVEWSKENAVKDVTKFGISALRYTQMTLDMSITQ